MYGNQILLCANVLISWEVKQGSLKTKLVLNKRNHLLFINRVIKFVATKATLIVKVFVMVVIIEICDFKQLPPVLFHKN